MVLAESWPARHAELHHYALQARNAEGQSARHDHVGKADDQTGSDRRSDRHPGSAALSDCRLGANNRPASRIAVPAELFRAPRSHVIVARPVSLWRVSVPSAVRRAIVCAAVGLCGMVTLASFTVGGANG